jgi:hypothetical protein
MDRSAFPSGNGSEPLSRWQQHHAAQKQRTDAAAASADVWASAASSPTPHSEEEEDSKQDRYRLTSDELDTLFRDRNLLAQQFMCSAVLDLCRLRDAPVESEMLLRTALVMLRPIIATASAEAAPNSPPLPKSVADITLRAALNVFRQARTLQQLERSKKTAPFLLDLTIQVVDSLVVACSVVRKDAGWTGALFALAYVIGDSNKRHSRHKMQEEEFLLVPRAAQLEASLTVRAAISQQQQQPQRPLSALPLLRIPRATGTAGWAATLEILRETRRTAIAKTTAARTTDGTPVFAADEFLFRCLKTKAPLFLAASVCVQFPSCISANVGVGLLREILRRKHGDKNENEHARRIIRMCASRREQGSLSEEKEQDGDSADD